MPERERDATLTKQQVGKRGCGLGTPNACFALIMRQNGYECSMISNPEVAQALGIQLGWRLNIDPSDGKAWCPKGVLNKSKTE